MNGKPTREQVEELAHKITLEAVKAGKLILAGWLALKLQAVRGGATQQQLENLRMAYYAGAEHLFSSIMSIMDPGEEPSDADMEKMELISNEIQEWRAEIQAQLEAAEKGNAVQ